MLRQYFILFFITTCFFTYGQNISVVDSVLFYQEQKEYSKAVRYAQQKANRLLAEKKYADYCDLCLQKADLFTQLGDNQKSIKVLYEALSVIDKNNIRYNKVGIYDNLGQRYAAIKDTAKTFKYYRKVLNLPDNTKELKNAYQNFFRLHVHTNPDSGYYYMKKKFAIDKIEKSPSGLASSYNNHFVYYNLKNQNDIAIKYLDSCFSISKENNVYSTIISALNNYAYYYMVEKQDYKTGINYLLESLDDYKEHMTDADLSFTYLNLAYAYENINDYQEANHYLNNSLDLNDKIYSNKIHDAVKESEVRYQIEKIEQNYSELTKELEVKQSRNTIIFLIFLALFGLTLILFYFFYQNLHLRQKSKIKEIDSEIQQNIINASIDGQEFERKKMSELLHDNISALLSSAGLHLSAYINHSEKPIPEEIIKSRTLLKEAHDKVRDLSHELIPPVLVKLGLFYAIQDLCDKNTNSSITFEDKIEIPFQKRFSEEFEFKVYFIISELVNNILKHSHATKATIKVKEIDNHLLFNIEDNGIGFDFLEPLSSEGFGLTQIKVRIRKMQGRIKIASKINVGTKIELKIEIPEE